MSTPHAIRAARSAVMAAEHRTPRKHCGAVNAFDVVMRSHTEMLETLREVLAAIDGCYLIPSGAFGTSTVPNPMAAVAATVKRCREAVARAEGRT